MNIKKENTSSNLKQEIVDNGPTVQNLNFGNLDDFINDLDDPTISNLDSFSLIQKDPELFYNSEENNKSHDNKLFSFQQDKKTSSPKGEIQMQYFETFNNNNTKNNSLLNTSRNNNNISNNSNQGTSEMVIDYSKFEKKEKNDKRKNNSITQSKNKGLEMFLVNNSSKKEIPSCVESKTCLLDNNESKDDEFHPDNVLDLKQDEKEIKSKKTLNTIGNKLSINSSFDESGFNSDRSNPTSVFTKTTNKDIKNNSKEMSSIEQHFFDKSNIFNQLSYKKSPQKSKKKRSYVEIVQNRSTTSRKRGEHLSLSLDRNAIRPTKLGFAHNTNQKYLTSFLTGSKNNNNCFEVSQLPIKAKKLNVQKKKKTVRKSYDGLSLSKEMEKANKICQYSNQKFMKNNGVVELLENIKEKYQIEEQRYIDKEQDLLNEIQILREKIKQFSINETNYQIEIEKLKRKKNNSSINLEDQQTSITNNTKISDISISKLDEFPKDLNSLLLKAPSNNVNIEQKKQSNSSQFSSNTNNCKVKSFFKLFKFFGLNKNLFCEKKDESDFMEDVEEIDYDAIFSKYPQIKSFIQLIANRLNKECESRLVLEEKTLQIFTNDIKTIDNLEKKLKKYENKNIRKKVKLNLNGSTSSIINNTTQNSIKSCDVYI